MQSTRTAQSTAQSPRTALSTATPETRAEGVDAGDATQLEKETHLYLGEQEMVNCFMQTSITAMASRRTDMFPFVATRFYRELHASEGSIIGESRFDRNQLQNLSHKFNVSLGCSVLNAMGDYCCAVRIRVATGLHVVVKVPVVVGSSLKVYDAKWQEVLSNDFDVNQEIIRDTVLFVGSSHILNVLYVLKQHDQHSHSRFVLRFQSVEDAGLQVRRTAFNKGVVQTPLYQDLTYLVTSLTDQWARVRGTYGHVVLVSFPRFEELSRCVAQHAGDRGNATLTRVLCFVYKSFTAPRSAVHNTSLLLVHLYTHDLYPDPLQDAKFQLAFSFHNRSAVPVKLADNLWNCSVPYSSDFLFHLSCNMEVECHDVEDEMNCPYTSDLCGPGYLTLGGACFFYVRRQDRQFSALMAADLRRRRGDRLAILNSAEIWDSVIKLLHTFHFGYGGIIVGLRIIPNTPTTSWYRGLYQWADGTTAFYLHSGGWQFEDCNTICGKIKFHGFQPKLGLLSVNGLCAKKFDNNILCEKTFLPKSTETIVGINGTSRWSHDTAHVECPLGHYTHHILACDSESVCWSRDHSSRCDSSISPYLPSFACTDQREHVPYTLVCDHRADCGDGSDFCSYPPCQRGQFMCDNKQCIPRTKRHDGWTDCPNREDEDRCGGSLIRTNVIPPPALISLSHRGYLIARRLNTTSTQQGGICPNTHFQCLDNGYCLPMFLRCNGVYDCPGREDEASCDVCPGFYRCRASHVCLHYSSLCDGHAHCPQHDDELMCDSTCPPLCVCRGLAFFCRYNFTASAYPLLRYLDASGSGMAPANLTVNTLLIHLTLDGCGLTHIKELLLPNLLTLDIQDNHLSSIRQGHFWGVPQLREVSVAGNPLVDVFGDEGLSPLHNIHKLDLSRTPLHVLNVTALSAFPKLQVLNLSHSGVQRVQGEGFSIIKQLRVIDLRGCPMTWFPRAVFQGLIHLQVVRAQSFKLCCPAVLPLDFNLHNCLAPSDEISSCTDLLRSNSYRVAIFILTFFAVTGNAGSFIFRRYVSKRENKLGYGNFVTHLSVSDFLMGIYLAIIGVADQIYCGIYLWHDVIWKNSITCKLAGFLSLLSSEVSALIMCLITLDRFLVLRFPFSRLHFSPVSAHLASVLVWICGILLVSVPLLPATSHWEFYSQTGICIPLPVTRADFAGRDYSFSILIVLNFVVFVIISLGQFSIYWSVRTNSMSVSNTTKKTKDLTIARRLITVAMSDFLCWFPIGILGLMASSGTAVPGEINVIVTIFVLPLNSAINPCLYTVNVVLECWRQSRGEKLRAFLLAQLQAQE